MIKKTFEDFILMLEGSSANQVKLDAEVEEFNLESWEKNKIFLHKFNSALEELPSLSWTYIAKVSTRRDKISGKLDSDEVWHDINTELKTVGLTWEDVKANKEAILDNIDSYSSLNAYVDIILYNLDNNYNVGGYNDDVESNFDEIIIKYRYGYHQTTYGRVFLKRYWGSVENFIEKYVKNILRAFITDTSCLERAYLKDIYEELDEYNGLIDWKDGILTIYFEHFYENVRHGILFAGNHRLDYDKFKAFFMNWLHSVNSDLEIEDFDDHLEVDFNCDL